MRFRSKLIEIDAECFIKDKPLPFRDERAVCYDGHNWYVESRGRKIVVDPGDWIIREPDGKGFYPCKSDIFVQRYEPITAEQLNDGALERLVEALRYAKAFGNHGVIEGGPHHGMSVSFFVNEALKPFTEQPNDHNA